MDSTRYPIARLQFYFQRHRSLVDSPILVFVAAVAVRAVIVVVLQLHLVPFRSELHRTAESLATTGMYGNPYLIPTGPTAHVSPAHTLLVAAVFSVFGTGIAGEVAQFVLNLTIVGLLYAALPWAAVRLGLSRGAGVAAAWFGALVPFHFLNDLRSGDAALSAFALMGILVTARPIIEGKTIRLGQSIVLGLAWGFSTLVLPTSVCVVATIAAAGFWVQRTWTFVGRIGVAAVVTILVLSPWALRNRAALGEAIWFRSTFGMVLRVSYNDLAWPDAERNRFGGGFELYHPFASVDAARRLLQEGEVAYNRRLRQESMEWIREHPARSAVLLAQRTFYFWFPRTPRLYQSLLLSALSLLAFAAIPRMLREYRSAGILLVITWVSFPFVYYAMESAIRYRYPMIWTLLLACAVLLGSRGSQRSAFATSATSRHEY